MFKYPPTRQSPHRASQTWITQLLWLLLSLCVLITMVKSAEAAINTVPSSNLWADPFTGTRYPSPLEACQANADWYNRHPSYGYRLSLASITTPVSSTDYWSCVYAGTLLKGNVPMPFPAANIPITRSFFCPAYSSLISRDQMTGGICACRTAYDFYPDATGTSCVLRCPAGQQPDAAGTACIEQFTLTLNVPAGDLEPTGTAAGDANSSKVMSVFVASVQTGRPKDKAVVRVTLNGVGSSGGHDGTHTGQRPNGTAAGCTASVIAGNYDCITGPDGKATFTYTAPEVSGTYVVSAGCTNVTCINFSDSKSVDVKVAGMSPIPAAAPLYVLEENIGGVMQTIGATVQHTNNHNVTSKTIAGLLELARKYHTEINPGASLYLNDASLAWGGLMDDSGKWKPPHSSHRKGDAIDIRADSANQKTGEVPIAFFRNMQALTAGKLIQGVDIQIHCYDLNGQLFMAFTKGANHPSNTCDNLPTNRHFHVVFKQ